MEAISNTQESVDSSKVTSVDNNVYETVDEAKLIQLQETHAWIADPIVRASEAVVEMPFYQWVKEQKNPRAFLRVAEQLYYHSATFPKVLGLMLGMTAMAENHMMPYYSKHAFGEADHSELLLRWMLKHDLLDNSQDINNVILTPETSACINMSYQLACERDREKWIVAINCGTERCSNDFFKVISKRMHEIGAGDVYFDIHVEADEFHSIMGLEYIDVHDAESIRGRQLIAKAMESVSVWAAMLHSWIDIDYHPKFDLQGNLLNKQ